MSLAVLAAIAMVPNMEGANSLYDFTMIDINGKPQKLNKFKGKVVMVVNTASRCGLTPQYKELQAVYDQYKGKGLVVLGFPANDFNGQEPGTDAEIETFCERNYGVTFPMFSKISVKGNERAELFKWLVANSDRPKDEVEWNFAKFLVSKEGKVIGRFAPQTKPDAPEILNAIKRALD
jgi:glutathione peroxidase